MKITRLGQATPLLSATSLGGSGGTLDPVVGGGLVPVASGSNSWSWGSNVSLITANGSNAVLGPLVNFAAGSNITLSVSSNTLTITSAAGGGSTSYGSNSNAVASANDGGASTLASRADHVHLGVRSLAHSSNSFSGPVILTASGTLGITSPTPGTYNLSAGTGGGGSGSVATDAIWDAKGDLAGGTGADTAVKLVVGTNGHVLTADSAETTGMKWAAASGGGGSAVAPDVINIYTQTATNSTTQNSTIEAAASGNRLVVVVNSRGRDHNTPTCTNVTFTKVLATNFSTTNYLSVWVGVVSGGASGTTVTVTATGSNWIITDIYEIADGLTPTAGSSATLTNTSAGAVQGPSSEIGRVAMTQGTFFVIAASQDDGSTAISDIICNSFLVKVPRGSNAALASGIGRAMGPAVWGYYIGGTSGSDMAAAIIAIT